MPPAVNIKKQVKNKVLRFNIAAASPTFLNIKSQYMSFALVLTTDHHEITQLFTSLY